VIVESGAGDFWIDQSEFLLVGDLDLAIRV